MFAPNQADVRRFFCQSFAKGQNDQPMEAIERLAWGWAQEHPEYAKLLANEEEALAHTGEASDGGENPFLHLSMHLRISEQSSIDQPPGIRQAVELLAAKHNDLHQAHHLVMDCLSEMLWQSQRNGVPPDASGYLENVRRLATRTL